MRHAASCDVYVQRDNPEHVTKCDCGAEPKPRATPAKWQTLTEEGDERTEALRVSGGWLYRTRTFQARYNPNGNIDRFDSGLALAFQPDPQEAR